MSGDDVIRIASANLDNRSIDPDRTTARLEQPAAALREWQPQLVLVQGLFAPGEDLVRGRFRALANATGLEPCALRLPHGFRRLRTGILADTAVLEILDDGPPATPDAACWAEATVRILVTGTVLSVASVYAPAAAATGQLGEARRLETWAAQRGQLAIAGGEWHCYSPAKGLPYGELAVLPPQLLPSRTHAAGGKLTPDYDVHAILACTGMAGPVPALPSEYRESCYPPGVGSKRPSTHRFYLWPGEKVMPAVRRYHEKPNSGSDHQMIMLSLDVAALAAACTPGGQS
jgi:hypothetical protein